MTTRIRLLYAFCILSISAVHAQKNDWRTMMGDPNANFFEIQESFYAEFGDSIGPKGSGWKQFKRWEYHYQDKVDEFGNLPDADKYLQELQKANKKANSSSKYTVGTGNWTELGPIAKPGNGTGQPNGNGRVSAIAFHPTDANTIFAGAPAGGFWKSTDGGSTWAKSIDGLTRLGVSSIVVDPVDPNLIYIGTGDRDGGDTPGYGVWRSTDGGATWAAHNNGMGNRTVYKILMDPTDNTRLIASTNGSRIYYSTDAGANWSFASAGTNSKDIEFKPGDPNTIYAAGTTFRVSTDGGLSYTQIFDIPSSSRIAIAVTPDQPDWVYALAGDGSGLIGVYQSKTSGASFTTQATTPNLLGYGTTGGTGSQAWYDLCLAVDPNDADVIYTGGINIWKSTDEGITYTLAAHWTGSGGADDVHADQHVLEFSPHNNDLYNGNDGGIYYTTDGGSVWTETSSGLGISQIYKIGVSQTVEEHVIAGFQDNGTAFIRSGEWQTEIGGDGMECIIDPTDESIMYGALYYGDIRRSTNSGGTFSSIKGTVTEDGGWVTPYKLDPSNSNRMYAGYDNIWVNTDVQNTTTWTQISSFTGTTHVRDLAIAPSNNNVMYVSRYTGQLYRCDNVLAATPTFNLITDPTGSGTVSDIAIDPTDELHVFATLGTNIYETTDGGSTWTDVSGTLPNITINTVVIDDNSSIDAMYIGNDAGIYYIDNTLADWEDFSTDLPNIEVTELEIYKDHTSCKGRLYAATYGQGLWVSDLKDPGNLSPTACFEASSTTVCEGSTVTFTDNSDFTPTSWAWQVSPTTIAYRNGTNATSQNPEIEFQNSGNYTVQLTATNTHGSNVESKTDYITVEAASTPTAYNLDFESLSTCGTSSDCGSTTCTLSGWTNLTNGTNDDIDWRVDEGGTPSSNTGPSIDHTDGTATGNYAYLEASSCYEQIAIMETGCIDLDINYNFELYYHMSGATMGSLHVDIYENGAWTEDFGTPISSDQGTTWQLNTLDLSSKTGELVKFRVRGVTGTSFTSDIALDDIAFVPGALPVEIINFSAKAMNDDIQLKWITTSEKNNDYFNIEKSTDGVNWIVVSRVNGVVTTNETTKYEITDEQPSTGINYYRLKQVDFSGDMSYSPIRTVEFNQPIIASVYPNPANSKINIQLNKVDGLQVHLTSALGQPIIVNKNFIGENLMTMDVSHVPSGVYYVTIYTNSTELESIKVVIGAGN